ncbi:hypothetical protein Poli38472_013379 [Pythium oligandrum]|uniref:Uncharacterized protein n=1 Tax=Pythium oligandrum TaxID=41045 RepID=A0A8K1C7W8_PYTOL|nr:hypothetical protein Poli38472_013379 [Pythium oligandrum]|eukprot:TMW57905.1 hypothetical protein Poli38472_013379 [Pythium oligandrum]
MVLSDARMHYYGVLYLGPVTMIINFALFQYLCGMYYQRRRERRVKLLLFFGLIGFVSLIPFSNPDPLVFDHLNDISETCTTMTFLVQITIIGRDINRKVRIRSLVWLTYISEMFTLIGVVLATKSFVEVIAPDTGLEQFDFIDDIFEDVSLWFIFVFRFYYMALSKGVRWLLQNKRLELFLYALLMTHEYPFLALNQTTGVSWESLQAIWHRLLVTMCLLQTIRDKIRGRSTPGGNSLRSQARDTNGTMSKGPQAEDLALCKGATTLSARNTLKQGSITPIMPR